MPTLKFKSQKMSSNTLKSIDSSALLFGLIQETETLIALNFEKLNKDKIKRFESFTPAYQEKILITLAYIQSYGKLLRFLSTELEQALRQQSNKTLVTQKSISGPWSTQQ